MSLAAALLGMGAWSIILGNLAFAVGSTIMIFSVTPRMPRFVYMPRHVAGLFTFGQYSLLDALLTTAIPRLFSFLVGYFEGIRVLGELNVAFRINDSICSLIGASASRLALPMFSLVAGDRRQLEQAFLQGTRVVFLVVAPAFLGLAFTSREIIYLALGPDWRLAASALVATCVYSLFSLARLLSHSTVKAVMRPALLIGPNVVGLLYITGGSLALRHYGFDAQLSVWASFSVVFMLCSLRMVSKAIGTDWLTQLRPLGSAALPSLAMCVVLTSLEILHPDTISLTMLLKVALGGSTYLVFVFALERPLVMQMLGRPARIVR